MLPEWYKDRPYPEVVYSKKWGTKKASFSKFEKVPSFSTTFCPFSRLPNSTARSFASTIARYHKHTYTHCMTNIHPSSIKRIMCLQSTVHVSRSQNAHELNKIGNERDASPLKLIEFDEFEIYCSTWFNE